MVFALSGICTFRTIFSGILIEPHGLVHAQNVNFGIKFHLPAHNLEQYYALKTVWADLFGTMKLGSMNNYYFAKNGQKL